MKYLLLFLILTSCAKHDKTVNIAADFQPYYYSFQRDAALQGRPLYIDDLIIEWGDLGGDINGVETFGRCHLDRDTPTITINDNPVVKSYMLSMGPDFMKMEVYHEMGHCVLGRGHDYDSWQTPDHNETEMSIMYPHPLPLYVFSAYNSHYLEELFNGR